MPGTLVCFHAHPDDEAIQTGGTIARAADSGHRVVIVFATRGELGEVADGFLDPGETLAERRARECAAAAEVLGAQRVAFLGYRDSGMAGEPTNDDPSAFWQADLDEAAERLAAILREEDAAILTIYDDHGGYHHPDHIQVHRVGVRAAAMAGTPRVYEATADRDHFVKTLRESDVLSAEQGLELPGDLPDPEDFVDHFTPAELITTRIDVSDLLDRKRAALRAHASQIDETSFFLALPDDVFAVAFGTEWFIRRGAPEGTRETWLFD
jgi:LmbE family N-acetylglucosaminyl deacetylase